MAIDAASYDSTAAARPVVARERQTSPSVSRDSEPVEIEGDMSFGDFLGVINPLQHLPIIGTLYRSLTGDTIQPAARTTFPTIKGNTSRIINRLLCLVWVFARK